MNDNNNALPTKSVNSIELQIISRILTTQSESEIDTLCGYDESYYNIYTDQIKFILEHRKQYGQVPDPFTFQAQFPTTVIVQVGESMDYLCEEICKNKRHKLLLEMFHKIQKLGTYDIDACWDYIHQKCDEIDSLDSTRPLDIVADAKIRAEQIVQFGKQRRIPTGFPEIDKCMYGGLSTVEELLIIVARTGVGKAQPLWSKVLTPSGWKTMGEIKVGDVVVGKNNDNGRVVEIFPQGEIDYYRVTFSDGTYAECCGNHLWEVLDHSRRRRDHKTYGQHMVITTDEIMNSMDRKYSVDISDPVEFNVPFDEDSELDGYLLGVLIGDGCLRSNCVTISNMHSEIWDKLIPVIHKYNCEVIDKEHTTKSIVGVVHGHNCNYIRNKLVEYGLMNKKSIDKFIPKKYLTAPVSVRKALLAGLVDTDGFISNRGGMSWEFDTASEQLALDFAELARSLGVFVHVCPREESYYKKHGVRIKAGGTRNLQCRSIFNPFTVPCKAERYFCKTIPSGRNMPKRHCKFITSIEYIGRTECQCILLGNESHTYITDDYTVTHNTWICTKIMESAQANGFPVLYYSPEMQASFLGTRFDTWRGHFQVGQLHQGKYDEAYKQYLEELRIQPTSAYVLEDKDVSGGVVSVDSISQMVKKYNVKLVVIDGLSYMADIRKATVDYERYKNICNDLFRMSKKFGCAVVVAMQANRETKDCKDEKGEPFPGIYQIEGSDHPARIATQVFAVRRVFDKNVLDIRMEKSRNANNQRPVFSYSWDPGTGSVQYLSDGEDGSTPTASVTPSVSIPSVLGKNQTVSNTAMTDDDFDDIEEEF